MKTIIKNKLSQWMTKSFIIIFMMILSANLFAQTAADLVNDINNWQPNTNPAIKLSAVVDGNEVTVTGNVTQNSYSNRELSLNIPADVKVIWEALVNGENGFRILFQKPARAFLK